MGWQRHDVVYLCLMAMTGAFLAWQPAQADEFPPELPNVEREKPSTDQPADPGPRQAIDALANRPIPELVGKGEEAQKNALAFIDWAASSTLDQADIVRRAVASARANRDIVNALCNEAFALQDVDHGRALIVLSLLGEMQSRLNEPCLTEFVQQPLPDKGTEVDGEILEQTALATLQAKAVDGLAYLRTQSADKLVLTLISTHPSRIVRAEAISAYLWNHAADPRVRDTLRQFVRPDEVIFIDRIVREAGEPGESFNKKLDTYLSLYPDLIPPPPEEREPHEEQPEPEPEF